MNEKKRRLVTGGFLVGSLLLVLAVLFFLGGRDLFTNKIPVCTYFVESVQGLSRGSAVKFKGAPIGTVSDVRIIFPNYVLVEMEIDTSRFAGDGGGVNKTMLKREVRQNGLNCRLEYVGITGLKFIDLDYHDTGKDKDNQGLTPPEFVSRSGALYIPSVKSSFTDISTSVAGAIDKINQINIREMGDDISNILHELRALISDPTLLSTIRHINEVAANLEETSGMLGRVIDEERVENLVNNLEETIGNLRTLMQRVDETAANANIPESTEAFRSAARHVSESATAFRRASEAVVYSRQELGSTLLKLNQTIDSLRLLIDCLERDPGSLLRGKAPRETE